MFEFMKTSAAKRGQGSMALPGVEPGSHPRQGYILAVGLQGHKKSDI